MSEYSSPGATESGIFRGTGGGFSTPSSIVGLTLKWKSNTELYITPGHVVHEEQYKGLSSLTSVDVTSIYGAFTTSEWLYAYADVNTPGSEPDWYFSNTGPTWRDVGPVHPDVSTRRFLGSMRIGGGGGIWYIRRFRRYAKDRVYYADSRWGQNGDVNYNLIYEGTPWNFPGETWQRVDSQDHIPPTASAALLTVIGKGGGGEYTLVRSCFDNPDHYFRVSVSEGGASESRHLEVAVNEPGAVAADLQTFYAYRDSNQELYIHGYVEPLD